MQHVIKNPPHRTAATVHTQDGQLLSREQMFRILQTCPHRGCADCRLSGVPTANIPGNTQGRLGKMDRQTASQELFAAHADMKKAQAKAQELTDIWQTLLLANASADVTDRAATAAETAVAEWKVTVDRYHAFKILVVDECRATEGKPTE